MPLVLGDVLLLQQRKREFRHFGQLQLDVRGLFSELVSRLQVHRNSHSVVGEVIGVTNVGHHQPEGGEDREKGGNYHLIDADQTGDGRGVGGAGGAKGHQVEFSWIDAIADQ